jgi:hypothetical protein
MYDQGNSVRFLAVTKDLSGFQISQISSEIYPRADDLASPFTADINNYKAIHSL